MEKNDKEMQNIFGKAGTGQSNFIFDLLFRQPESTKKRMKEAYTKDVIEKITKNVQNKFGKPETKTMKWNIFDQDNAVDAIVN